MIVFAGIRKKAIGTFTALIAGCLLVPGAWARSGFRFRNKGDEFVRHQVLYQQDDAAEAAFDKALLYRNQQVFRQNN